MSAHEDWTTPPVTEHEAIPALAGDLGVHDSQAPARDTGWMRGPGNAGSYWCNCDDPIALDWPEWTTDEDRATMLRLRGRHAATHKTSSGKSQPLPPAAPESRTSGEEAESCSPGTPSRPTSSTVHPALTLVTALFEELRAALRGKDDLGYFTLRNQMASSRFARVDAGDVERDARFERVDEDRVLPVSGSGGVDSDLGTDRPVQDRVPLLVADAHDSALVDAASDEVGSVLQRLSLDAYDHVQVGTSGPEGIHVESVPDGISDTPDPGVPEVADEAGWHPIPDAQLGVEDVHIEQAYKDGVVWSFGPGGVCFLARAMDVRIAINIYAGVNVPGALGVLTLAELEQLLAAIEGAQR